MKHPIRSLFALFAVCVFALSGCSALLVQAPQRQAGPEVAQIAQDFAYAQQEVKWQRCGGFECAQVRAPLDWDNPRSGEAVTLQLAMLRSTSERPRGTIFVNPGGPGASGISYLQNARDTFTDLRAAYNIASWDPRGVGASTAVQCYSDAEMDELLFGADDSPEAGTTAWLDRVKADNQKRAQKCYENSGKLINYVSTASTVRDLDMLRGLLGDDQLHYIGLSYGTHIGALYADTFPQKAGKLVLDGAVDPAADVAEVVANQTRGFEQALESYLTACTQQRDCWFQGDVNVGKEKIKQILADVDANPIAAPDGRFVTSSVLVTAIVRPLYSQQSWSYLSRLFTELADRKTTTALLLADSYYDRAPNGRYANNSAQAFKAINCADFVQRQPDLERMRQSAAQLAQQLPILGPYQGFSEAGCWGWPVAGQDTGVLDAPGANPIVVVGTTGDPATPYNWAVQLAENLDSGVLVTYEGEGHVAFGDSTCVNQLVADFFLRDTVPAHQTVCRS